MANIETNLRQLQQQIERAATAADRDSEEITLIAVSKIKPRQDVEAALAAGQKQFGENKVQEAVDKFTPPVHGAELHLIGPLQSNKTRDVASLFDWINTLDRLKIIRRLEKHLAEAGRTMKALIQVNIAGEEQKSGCNPEEVPELIAAVKETKHLELQGLMIIPPLEDDPEKSRVWFRKLANLRSEMEDKTGVSLAHLSMGMSGDFDVAIQEGATMIRVGTAIFGEREYGNR